MILVLCKLIPLMLIFNTVGLFIAVDWYTWASHNRGAYRRCDLINNIILTINMVIIETFIIILIMPGK